MKVLFSVDRYDRDGDKCENGIYLHLNDSIMLRFANLIELRDFQIDLAAMMKEITEQYVEAGE